MSETLIRKLALDLEKEPLMVWEGSKTRGRKCVSVYAELAKKGYEFPRVDVFSREGIHHLTGQVEGQTIFSFGGHHRAMGHLLAGISLPVTEWSGPGTGRSGREWNVEYYSLRDLQLVEGNCPPCGEGYTFWDYVKEADAREIAEKLDIRLRPGQKFLDS